MVDAVGALWLNRSPFDSSGALYRIDPGTNQLAATVQVSPPGDATGAGNDIAYGFGSIWEVNWEQYSVSRIDPATDAVTAVISVATDGGSAPEGVAITPNAVWVAEHEPVGTIVKIDPNTNTVVGQIRVGGVPAGGPPYITVAAGSIWGNGPSQVVRIDPQTDAVTPVTGRCQGTGGYKLATDGVSLWASNCVAGLTRVDPATNTLKTVLAGAAFAAYNGGSPPNFALAYGGGLLWATGACGKSDCAWAINPAANEIVKAWTLPVAAGDDEPLYAYNTLWISTKSTLLRLNPGP